MFNFWRAGTGTLLLGCVAAVACGQTAGTLGFGGGSPGSGGGGADGSVGAGSTGSSSGPAGSSGGGDGSTGTISPGAVTVTPSPWDAKTASEAVRKVKELLIGLPPTDAEVTAAMAQGAAALQGLIGGWITDPSTQPFFRDKMLVFFRNTFQQVGFTPTVDFQNQLLQNGGFDFGPFGTAAVGDDSFARLVQNLQDEFAMTAWQLIQDGHSFLETLTTPRYMMTTGLKMVYLQVEMPDDQPYAFGTTNKLPWKIDYSGNPIALTDSLNPSSPSYLVFDDEPPAVSAAGGIFGSAQFPTCRGSTTTPTGTFSGYAQLFQRIIGFTPRFPFAATPTCWEHPSKPYLTTSDVSDWQWVTIAPKAASDPDVAPYDLPTLRMATTLKVALPRVGFYTTPAFLALWNTNDSNQHRVTTNQTLLAALGESFSSEDTIVPLSETGLDPNHATTTSQCYACHKALDPMRGFWNNQFDFNDRNDFPSGGLFQGATTNPRPATTGGVFAFATVNAPGASMLDFGPLVAQVTNGGTPTAVNQFAVSVAQKLCYFANSSPCDVTDPTFLQIAGDFAAGNGTMPYDFAALIKELFASPLVTGAVATQTFAQNTVPISIARRDHFCAALSNRLGIPDVCALAVTLPTAAQTTTATIAGSVVADSFGRGTVAPVTPADPNLFFRAGVEQLCTNIAPQVVDAASNTVWTSTNAAAAIPDMVERVIGYPASDAKYASALAILQSHMQSAQAQGNASNALRSTFVLACESPTSVSVGL